MFLRGDLAFRLGQAPDPRCGCILVSCLPERASFCPCTALPPENSPEMSKLGEAAAGTCLGRALRDLARVVSSPRKVTSEQSCLLRPGANFLPPRSWQPPTGLTRGCSGGAPGHEGLVSF